MYSRFVYNVFRSRTRGGNKVKRYQRQWKLEEMRETNKVTQEDLANLLNINTTTYRRKEKGDAEFKGSEMFAIAKRFNVEIEDIFLPPKFTISEQTKQEA